MLPRTPLNVTVGFALTRIIVPLWILMGITLKLQAGDPRLLPGVIWMNARNWGIDLGHLLYTLIGLEIFAVAVMVLLARFAKPMAIFMLTSFCAILIGEMIRGADSCGCFGSAITIKPWQMLIADSLLLIAVIIFPVQGARVHGGTEAQAGKQSSWVGSAVAAALLLIVGLGASFTLGNVLHPERQQIVDDDENGDADDPTRNPSPRSLPAFWYTQNLDGWVGKPWREAELFQFMRRWPAGLDEGVHYVVFYNRTCTHCEEMFYDDLTRPLAAPVIAIEIPYARDAVTSPDAWPMPPEESLVAMEQHLVLTMGTDWIIQSPLTMRIEDGVVTCVEEGDHQRCFDLQ